VYTLHSRLKGEETTAKVLDEDLEAKRNKHAVERVVLRICCVAHRYGIVSSLESAGQPPNV